MDRTELLQRTADKFSASEKKGKILIGFDGFVDNILRPVRSRENLNEFSAIDNIPEFAERIGSASGKSTNIEIVKTRSSFGGNGPIMANSLIDLGNEMTYIGSLGKNGILPIFQPFADKCEKVISFSDPGITDAFEMNDGKVMFNHPAGIMNISWDSIIDKVGYDTLKERIEEADHLAFVNWTMIPMMNAVFENLIKLLSELSGRRSVYIDLTDPRKRSREDLKKCIDLLVEMNQVADVILGLNESEAQQIAEVSNSKSEYSNIEELAYNIRKNVPLRAIVIHSIKQASSSSVEGSFIIDGPYTSEPKLSTGAGDIFNAGFYAGYITGLDFDECLVLGTANSGFYVRNERPPLKDELIKFIDFIKNYSYNT